MHPGEHARLHPDKPAVVMADGGQVLTYRELDERSNQGAQLFRSLGLDAGDHVAFCLENHPRFFELCWAAQRAGLIYTAISSRLTPDEAEYIAGISDWIKRKAECGYHAIIRPPSVGGLGLSRAHQRAYGRLDGDRVIAREAEVDIDTGDPQGMAERDQIS